VVHFAVGRRGAVASGDPRATLAGLHAMESGGNAIDAAAAAATTQWVVLPDMCGPGGDLFALVKTPRRVVAVNASGAAPAGGVPAEGSGPPATTPAAVAGLSAVHGLGGQLPYRSAFDVAGELAAGGFALSPDLVRSLRGAPRQLTDQLAAEWRTDLTTHHLARWPTLAQSLVALAAQDGLHASETVPWGAAVEDWSRHGCRITQNDLASATADVAPPLTVDIGPWTVATNPPVSQGILFLLALKIAMRGGSGDGRSGDFDELHTLIESAKLVFAERGMVRDGAAPECHEILANRSMISAFQARLGPTAGPAPTFRPDYSHETAHIAAVDEHGNLVSLIHSLYHPFGSAIMSKRTGFILNDRGRGFDQSHGVAAAGSRPPHTLMNVFATRRRPNYELAMGTPGADGQVQANLQVLARVLHSGPNDWAAAIGSPRWRLGGDRTLLVEDGFSEPAANSLRCRGHVVSRAVQGDRLMGAVGLVGRADGQLIAAQDSRRSTLSVAR